MFMITLSIVLPLKLGLFLLRQRLRQDKLGLNWVRIGVLLAKIGFVLGSFGFVLALFFLIDQVSICSYYLTNKSLTFIWLFLKLGSFCKKS